MGGSRRGPKNFGDAKPHSLRMEGMSGPIETHPAPTCVSVPDFGH